MPRSLILTFAATAALLVACGSSDETAGGGDPPPDTPPTLPLQWRVSEDDSGNAAGTATYDPPGAEHDVYLYRVGG